MVAHASRARLATVDRAHANPMNSELGRKEAKAGRFTSRLVRVVLVAAGLVVAYLGFVKLERSRPTLELGRPITHVGERGEIVVVARDRGTGLARVEVALEVEGARFEIGAEEFPTVSWRGSGVAERVLDLRFAPREGKVPEGTATLVVRATDHSWLNFFFTRRSELAQPVEVDYSPPRVEVLTAQHYMRLGGSDMVVYRSSSDAVRTGVAVDGYWFPGEKGLFPDREIAVALFAVPHDLSTSARPKVVAEDAAGNRREVGFYVSVKPQSFRERTLEIDDRFLENVIPDLLRVNGLPPMQDLVAGYLEVNRNLRKASEERIREVCARSEPRPLWKEVFLRQPNSAPLSHFADRRSYSHDGKIIDQQTHLGFDLASLRMSPVAAGNDGKVAFADNLGIYGNTVILDHGLGLFTLYGHLSSIAVATGESVTRGQSVGQTGATGLAGGDHLHFSSMIRGIHVDPVEWWDPKWIRDHVTAKIEEFEKLGTDGVSAAVPAPSTGS
jgi:murein DD-endopeptidase MepM/ murein hydrolase activator NlpD